MKKLWFVVLNILLAASIGAAQAPQPAPQPTPPDDDVVKISTNLIQVDVTVVDSKGKVITDLKPEEVEIYENGQKQNITNFSFISSVRPSAVKSTTPDANPV